MSKRTVFLTFVAAVAIVAVVGFLSFWMVKNQPSADISRVPSLPPVPGATPQETPVAPPAPRLKGDANNDGIVDVRDINVLISHWGQVKPEYNLVDDPKGKQGVINVLDLAQVIKYWKCTEGKEGCGYYDEEESPAPEKSVEITAVRGQVVVVPGTPFSIVYSFHAPKNWWQVGGDGTYYLNVRSNGRVCQPQQIQISPPQSHSFGCYNGNNYTIEVITDKSDQNKATLKITTTPLEYFYNLGKSTVPVGETGGLAGVPFQVQHLRETAQGGMLYYFFYTKSSAPTCGTGIRSGVISTSSGFDLHPVVCTTDTYVMKLVASESDSQKLTFDLFRWAHTGNIGIR